MIAFARPIAHRPRFAPGLTNPNPGDENMAVWAADVRRKQQKTIRDIKASAMRRAEKALALLADQPIQGD